VLPLPLVPAATRVRSLSWGLPRSASSPWTRTSPGRIPNLLRLKSQRVASSPATKGGARSRPDGVLQVFPLGDNVHHPVLEQELGGLETFRQISTNSLFDDPGTGKTDQGAGFGHIDVAKGGVTGGHPAGGGIGQDRDVGNPLLAQAGQYRAGLGHLHQGKQGLLHPRTAAAAQDDGCLPVAQGIQKGPGDFFTHDRSHAAAHEGKIHDGNRNGNAP